MGENELYQIAFHFREAIVAAKTNGEFSFRDRMQDIGVRPLYNFHMIISSVVIYLVSYVVYEIYTRSIGNILKRLENCFPVIKL